LPGRNALAGIFCFGRTIRPRLITTPCWVSEFSDETQNEINEKIRKSKDLLIVGVALGRTLSLHYHTLEAKLRNGDSIRIILVNPENVVYQFTAYRHYRHISPESEYAEIMSSLESLCKNKETTSGNLNVRVIDYPLDHGGIFVDSNVLDGALFLWPYGFKTHLKPKVVLYPIDKQWYSFFREEAESTWNNAKPWNFKKVKQK
jgi:hypothetical protein